MRNFDYMGDDLKSSRGLVDEGVSLNFGPLSLCRVPRIIGRAYQTDCFHYKVKYTNLFEDFEVAFNKFVELKEELLKSGYKEMYKRG